MASHRYFMTAMTACLHNCFPAFPEEDCRFHRTALQAQVHEVMTRGQYILGTEVAAFEREFGAWLGISHVVGVGSGTDAIELMLRALDLGGGAGVVAPSFAPSAVGAAVQRAGARLVLADIEPDTFTLCPASLDRVLRSRVGRGVRAALVVHLYGHPADWSGLQRVADEHGILLLEDAAQAHGAVWQGRRVGTLARAAAFSFYPTKNLGALGDAGAVVTADSALAERVRELRQYGWRERYMSASAGINSRLDELQAAVLRVKLRTLDEMLARRRSLARHYRQRLGSLFPVERPGCEHAWHLLVIRSTQRDALIQHLQACGIPAAVHYPGALHQQPAFRSSARLPESRRAAEEVLSLPLNPYLQPEAASLVADALESFAHAACRV